MKPQISHSEPWIRTFPSQAIVILCPPEHPTAAFEALPSASEAFLIVFETLPAAVKALQLPLKAFLPS